MVYCDLHPGEQGLLPAPWTRETIQPGSLISDDPFLLTGSVGWNIDGLVGEKKRVLLFAAQTFAFILTDWIGTCISPQSVLNFLMDEMGVPCAALLKT